MLWDPKNDLDAVGKQLYAAAGYIEEHGWTQYRLSDKYGVCIFGAMMITGADSQEALERLDKHCRQLLIKSRIYPHTEGPIPLWNDLVCRSKAEAVQCLRDAARAK